MKSGANRIDGKFVEEIANNNLPYADTILIGDNSSGKSWVLFSLAKILLKNKQDFYFIDAVNRGFDIRRVTASNNTPQYAPSSVVECRLKEDIFNLQDSFSMYGTATERIEQIYTYFQKKVQKMFKRLTKDCFSLTDETYLGIVKFDKSDAGLLSSGYQAIIRILLELVYYSDKLKLRDGEKKVVIIDELDEFLSPKVCSNLWMFLKKEFPNLSFIVSTHSSDLIVGAEDANIIVLADNNYEILDSNDYLTQTDVQCVFERVFGEEREYEVDPIDEALRRLMNNRAGKIWTKKEDDELAEIAKRKLSRSQELIVKQIREW